MKTYQQIETETGESVARACAAYKDAEPADRLAFERGYLMAALIDARYELDDARYELKLTRELNAREKIRQAADDYCREK